MIRPEEQTFSGELRQYLLNREGDIDGLLLCDGTQVHFPPHLGVELAEVIQPGSMVTIQGQREPGGVIEAFAITNQSTGQTVVDDGPPPPPLHGPLAHRGAPPPLRHPAPPAPRGPLAAPPPPPHLRGPALPMPR